MLFSWSCSALVVTAVLQMHACGLAAVGEQLVDGQAMFRANVSTSTDRSTNTVNSTKMSKTRKGRKFLGKIGFLAGFHIGSGISSSGSLAASHSVKVFGKVMNTALSVSYGPAGPPGGLGGPGGGPGPILQDPPSPAEDTPATGKPVALDTPTKVQDGRIQDKMMPRITNSSQEGITHEEGQTANEDRQEATEDNEVIVEEVEPPPTTTKRTLFQYLSRRQASIEQKPNTSIDRQRIEFLKDHHRHIATFNQHFQKLSGDVSKVVRISGG